MSILTDILQQAGLASDDISNVHIHGADPVLPTPFPIGEAGAAALAAVGYIVSELWALQTGRRQTVDMDVYHAALSQISHKYLRVLDGETPALWDHLSDFYQTQDHRWIQCHCNFIHHRQGLVEFLQCEDNKASVAAAIQQWPAEALETQLSTRGLCAAMVRSSEEWQAAAQAQAIARLPLFEIIKIGDSSAEPLVESARPLSDIRVLDLSRVIAGPVCGKVLAEHGATVMQVSHPRLPFIAPLVMDTGHGKLSTYLDLNQPQEKQNLLTLSRSADIFLQAYRPGALAEYGFSPEALAQIRPGIIYISLSAYSHVGPWADRHGYDSLVQSVTGIVAEQSPADKPQHLPAQSLDYITGFLAAFAAMEALRRRATEGGSYLIRVSLAQTAQWLKDLPRVTRDFSICKEPTREAIQDLLIQSSTAFGNLEYLKPILHLSETSPYYTFPSVPLGKDLPVWPTTKS